MKHRAMTRSEQGDSGSKVVSVPQEHLHKKHLQKEENKR